MQRPRSSGPARIGVGIGDGMRTLSFGLVATLQLGGGVARFDWSEGSTEAGQVRVVGGSAGLVTRLATGPSSLFAIGGAVRVDGRHGPGVPPIGVALEGIVDLTSRWTPFGLGLRFGHHVGVGRPRTSTSSSSGVDDDVASERKWYRKDVRPYLDLLRHVLDNGERRTDRTGTGTLSLFGAQSRYDLRQGFPLVTTKKVLFPAVVRELLWFLRGSTNIHDDLHQHTPIWDAWADDKGELGPIYGYQWRNWGGDQITQAIETIKKDPTSRRIIVSAWNVADIPKMKLPPCHAFFQFYVQDEWLDCQLYQRSADLALGVPFNIASYALLMSMVAQECELTPRFFVHTLGDAHIYLNHVEGVKTQLQRDPLPLPKLVLSSKPTLEIKFEDVVLENYQHHPFIKFPVAV